MHLLSRCTVAILTVAYLSTGTLRAAAEPCQSFFNTEESIPEDLFADSRSLFSQTLPATVANAFVVLLTTQLLSRGPASVAESSFIVTAISDPLATVIGSYFSLNESDFIVRVRERMGKAGEFASRSAINAAIGTAVISATWLATKLFSGTAALHDVGRAFCASGAVCVTFYPTLQLLREGLFKKIPAFYDAKIQQSLTRDFPKEFQTAFTEVLQRAIASGVPPANAKRNLISALAGFLRAKPYEASISDTSLLANDKQVESILEDLRYQSIINERTPIEQLAKVNYLRSLLIHRLLKLYDRGDKYTKAEVARVLAVGSGFSEKSTIALHRALDDRQGNHGFRIFGASLVDISYGVIVGGAIMVQAASYWFLHNELPWQFFGLM